MKQRESQIGSRAYEHQCEEEMMMHILNHARRACADCHLPPVPERLVAVSIAMLSALYLRERAGARIAYNAETKAKACFRSPAEQKKMVNSLSPRFMSFLDTILSAEHTDTHSW